MSKQPVTPLTHGELIRDHPLSDLVPGWYFRQIEKSAGVWDVEGRDAYGRSISKFSVLDERAALEECVEMAKKFIASGQTK